MITPMLSSHSPPPICYRAHESHLRMRPWITGTSLCAKYNNILSLEPFQFEGHQKSDRVWQSATNRGKMWSHFTLNLLREIDWALSAHWIFFLFYLYLFSFFFCLTNCRMNLFFLIHFVCFSFAGCQRLAIAEPRVWNYRYVFVCVGFACEGLNIYFSFRFITICCSCHGAASFSG